MASPAPTGCHGGPSRREHVAWSKATAARLNLPPERQATTPASAFNKLCDRSARDARTSEHSPPTNAMGYPPETVFILPNSMPMAQLALADGRPFRH
ncbi:hypothetical protein PAPYR_12048 [Paratrimastix pyriformis]|uniref:Uncharacterized protein n=1 Tax=Paratrimastix pyriformis TaxID=342808 RepID=A0ABQ8U2L7_9EUKA|nr:hypothetical protein PAPYR_12048 [Paratrimastix pyriformis]